MRKNFLMKSFQAKNIVNYLRIIHRLMAPNGVWVNLGRQPPLGRSDLQTKELIGPLLWHFENNDSHDLSIEFDLEEVKALARGIGFEIKVGYEKLCMVRGLMLSLQDEQFIKSSYVGNPESMLSHTYDCALWTATKGPQSS